RVFLVCQSLWRVSSQLVIVNQQSGIDEAINTCLEAGGDIIPVSVASSRVIPLDSQPSRPPREAPRLNILDGMTSNHHACCRILSGRCFGLRFGVVMPTCIWAAQCRRNRNCDGDRLTHFSPPFSHQQSRSTAG